MTQHNSLWFWIFEPLWVNFKRRGYLSGLYELIRDMSGFEIEFEIIFAIKPFGLISRFDFTKTFFDSDTFGSNFLHVQNISEITSKSRHFTERFAANSAFAKYVTIMYATCFTRCKHYKCVDWKLKNNLTNNVKKIGNSDLSRHIFRVYTVYIILICSI